MRKRRGSHEAAASPPAPPIGLKPRIQLKDPEERDDLKQAITIVLATIQRERARADQFYTRARNLLAYSSALFVAVQTAFLANLGRTGKKTLLITASERGHVAVPALVALILLVIAALVLFALADRARTVKAVTGDAVLQDLYDPEHKLQEIAPLQAMLGRLEAEERSWRETNKSRGKLNVALAVFCAGAAMATLTEMVFLYRGLA